MWKPCIFPKYWKFITNLARLSWTNHQNWMRMRDKGSLTWGKRYTIPDSSYRGTKTIPDRTVLFTYKKDDYPTVSETYGIWAAPNSKVERHISDKFSATLWCGVGRFSDGSGSKSKDWNPVKLVQECGLGFSAPWPSPLTAPPQCLMWVNDLLQSRS